MAQSHSARLLLVLEAQGGILIGDVWKCWWNDWVSFCYVKSVPQVMLSRCWRLLLNLHYLVANPCVSLALISLMHEGSREVAAHALFSHASFSDMKLRSMLHSAGSATRCSQGRSSHCCCVRSRLTFFLQSVGSLGAVHCHATLGASDGRVVGKG